MRIIVKSFKITLLVLMALILADTYSHAHPLEPLGTEITDIVPTGEYSVKAAYSYDRTNDAENIDTHSLPLEIEIGLTERTEFVIESEVLLANIVDGDTGERGIEEIAFGVKRLLMEDSDYFPDTAIGLEFAPVTAQGEGMALSGMLIFSKLIKDRIYLHANFGYEFEREHVDDATDLTNTIFYNLAFVYRFIPNVLSGLVELNAEHHFPEEGATVDRIVVVPEIILQPSNKIEFLTLKFGVPIGVTNGSSTPDWGIKAGLSFDF